LYKWVKQAQDPQKSDTSFSTKEKLQILHETYAMSKEEVNAYCREKGLFKHQLQEFEEEFLNQKSSKVSEEETSKKALEEEKNKTKALAKELRRKEKALAETAALLVLQKKFQALFEDEEV
jgi:transposase-like protein